MREYLTFWYEALGSPYGVIVETDDPEGFRQQLYRARASARDPDLSSLTLAVIDGQVWIVRSEK